MTQIKISQTKLAVLSSLLFVLLYNFAFFRHVVSVYPLSWENAGFLLSLAAGLATVITLLISLLSSEYTTKFVLILFFLLSSVSAYFMDNFDIVIDKAMIRSIFDTSPAEVTDLLNIELLGYLILLGILPSLLIYKIKIAPRSFKKSFIDKTATVVVSIMLLLLLMLPFSRFYTSFFREQKPLRYYTNPTYYIYSTGKYLGEIFDRPSKNITKLGLDAKITRRPDARKKLIILVLGEAARADHFSLNGYQRETNPLLQQESIINFSQMRSCGTSTAYSIPCMFSHFTRAEYSEKKAQRTENVLDVLQRTGSVNILWRDNNSDSKGVALRVTYEDFRSEEQNPVCADGECRDEGMLTGLSRRVEENKDKDMLIILHQMGNHGPAYYKRYPKGFEFFKPVCPTNQIERCSNEEIINTYDNALRYTDYFLSKVINFLKQNQDRETAMLYIADHGESLGEGGLYLHGIPYSIAPDAQTHIGALLWFSEQFCRHFNLGNIKGRKDAHFSHDNLFHTLLGLFEVQTSVYNPELDMLH
ncbi:phosphoethanolamine transferase [Candidatus Electronema sp. JM]|uniref:phosphoethanolamine transferase n=1 Tax=Candidatus Electronema sp. JM TaxID=3401571 RepID=UPI003AA9CC5A